MRCSHRGERPKPRAEVSRHPRGLVSARGLWDTGQKQGSPAVPEEESLWTDIPGLLAPEKDVTPVEERGLTTGAETGTIKPQGKSMGRGERWVQVGDID